MIFSKLFQCDSSNSRCFWFCFHIGYKGIMILRELSLHDSSTLLYVLFCIHIGYRGIMILCNLSLHDSSIPLCVWFCILGDQKGTLISRYYPGQTISPLVPGSAEHGTQTKSHRKTGYLFPLSREK